MQDEQPPFGKLLSHHISASVWQINIMVCFLFCLLKPIKQTGIGFS